MLNSSAKHVSFQDEEIALGNGAQSEMLVDTGSLASSSSLTNTDSETTISGKEKPAESPASVQEHNHNHVKNPTLWFKGTEGRKKRIER